MMNPMASMDARRALPRVAQGEENQNERGA